jgi:hypothetical protein
MPGFIRLHNLDLAHAQLPVYLHLTAREAVGARFRSVLISTQAGHRQTLAHLKHWPGEVGHV